MMNNDLYGTSTNDIDRGEDESHEELNTQEGIQKDTINKQLNDN
jgi:hypothetical protein